MPLQTIPSIARRNSVCIPLGSACLSNSQDPQSDPLADPPGYTWEAPRTSFPRVLGHDGDVAGVGGVGGDGGMGGFNGPSEFRPWTSPNVGGLARISPQRPGGPGIAGARLLMENLRGQQLSQKQQVISVKECFRIECLHT